MIIKCPECGHQVSDQAKTCPSCGIEIAGKITRCPDCGEVIFKEQAECPICHRVINGAVPSTPSLPPIQPLVSQNTEADEPQADEEKPKATVNGQLSMANGPRRRPKAGYIALVVAFVIALIVVFLGIYFYRNVERQNTQRAYDNAIQSDQPAVLQNFLDMYPEAPVAMKDSVKAHLEELKKIDLAWANAVASGSKSELEKYIKLHPQSIRNVEAKLKIDSIDWKTAQTANTLEALKLYLEQHEDGQHYDEARNLYERLDAQRITAEDQKMASEVLTAFFDALSKRDEVALTSTLAPVLTSFLHRDNATKTDVMQYMHKLYEDDVTSISFTPNNDWHLEKTENADGLFSFVVDFSVDERLERTDQDKERFATFKVNAHISTEGKISALNMKRVVQ